MKAACVGGGPAGLYLSILLKRQDPAHDVTVQERNPEGSTYGWGATYWHGLLDLLRVCDPESARAVEQCSVRWSDGVGCNHYVWLGTTKVFDAFTFPFVDSGHGWIWCYGYGYGEGHSTCVVECAPHTYTGLGLDRLAERDQLALLEELFAGVLDGHPLIGRAAPDAGAAPWPHFRTLTDRTWYRGNLVLLGDAAHTTHYSIGAGTTFALEDAICLAGALREHTSLPQALAAYESRRRTALLSAQCAARLSAQWYENLPRYTRLPPHRMFAPLGQRHSLLLPYVLPQLYYGLDKAAGQLEALRRLKRWLGPRVARSVQARAGRE